MSVAAMDRVSAIQQQLAALSGVQVTPRPSAAAPAAAGAAAPASFSAALAAAQAPGATTSTVPTGPVSGTPYAAEINAAAARHGLDPALLRGLIKQESGFNPNARSGAGAVGLTQLMPGTAASLGVTDPSDPAQAIEGGAKYLAQQMKTFGGDVEKALAAYNAGPGNVQKYGGVPPFRETQNYVQRVLANAREGATTT